MNITHISSDYPFTPLYSQLLRHFKDPYIHHTMYVPLMHGRSFDKRYDVQSETVKVVYSHDFSRWDRFLQSRKQKLIASRLREQLHVGSEDLIHAHYLFAAGGVALQIKKEIGTEYICAVRNADLNYHFKYGIFHRKHGVEILENASKVVFIAPAYKEKLCRRYLKADVAQRLRAKSLVIPNGIDDFWLENRQTKSGLGASAIKFIYVGEFSKNKNLATVVKAVQYLRQQGRDARLLAVGGAVHDAAGAAEFYKLVEENPEYLQTEQWIKDKTQLCKRYREADIFIMPSLHETFGMVFIEAMSQGLPVIYTEGEGIDGYFEQGSVGYSVNPLNVQQIAESALNIVENYSEISAACAESVDRFGWDTIAAQYEDLYRM